MTDSLPGGGLVPVGTVLDDPKFLGMVVVLDEVGFIGNYERSPSSEYSVLYGDRSGSGSPSDRHLIVLRGNTVKAASHLPAAVTQALVRNDGLIILSLYNRPTAKSSFIITHPQGEKVFRGRGALNFDQLIIGHAGNWIVAEVDGDLQAIDLEAGKVRARKKLKYSYTALAMAAPGVFVAESMYDTIEFRTPFTNP